MTETTITAALVKALGELEQPRTDEKANTGQYAYAYLSLPGLISHVKPVLSKHGLAFMQNVETRDGWLQVETVVLHESGTEMRFGPLAFPLGANAQQSGSAITYARRYALAAALGIAPEEDNDAAGVTYRPTRDVDAAPNATSTVAGDDGPEAPAVLRGEGAAGAEGPRPPAISIETKAALTATYGSAAKAKAAAQAAFGDDLGSIRDLTEDQGQSLLNAKAAVA